MGVTIPMSKEGDLGGQFARSAGWVLVEQWSTKIISLVIFAVLARLLEPSDFGLVALATAFIAILQVFANSGFSKALIQKRELEPKDASTAFWTSLLLSVVAYALLVATAPAVSQLFGEPRLHLILVVLGAVVPLSALSRIPAALLARDFSFRTLSLRTMVATVIGAAVTLPLALAGAGVWALVAQAIAEAAIAVLVMWASTPWRPSFTFSKQSLQKLWRTGIGLLGIELLDAMQSQADKLVIGALFSTTDLGIYSLAQRLGVMLQELVSSVITRVSLTTFSRTQDDLPRVNRIFRQLTFATATLSFPVFAMVAVLSAQIIPFMFGSGWDEAVPLVWVMAGGWAFAAVAMFDRSALVGTGNVQAAFWLALIQNVLSIVLVFVFAPLGILGIAFSRFARLLTWPIRLWALHRYIGLRTWRYVWQILKSSMAVAPAVLLIAWLQTTPYAALDHAFWLFAVPLAVGGLSMSTLTAYLLASTEDRASFKKQVRSALKKRK